LIIVGKQFVNVKLLEPGHI